MWEDTTTAESFKEIQNEGHVQHNEGQWKEVTVQTPSLFTGQFDFEAVGSLFSSGYTSSEPEPLQELDVLEVL